MIPVILDSGAFSAFGQQGVELNIRDYIAYIKANAEFLQAYVALDVIPGTNGQWDTGAQSYANHQRMKDAGLTPIPVFHQGDSWAWLERMIEDGEPYIGLSHVKTQAPKRSIGFLDACFDRLIASGRPLIKTHGFGLTDVYMLHRYPWTTSDSRTWSRRAATGQVIVPWKWRGDWDHTLSGQPFFMTDRTRGRPKHIDDCASHEIDDLRDYLAEFGIKLAEARYDQKSRELVQLGYFRRVEDSVQSHVTCFRHPAWAHRSADRTFEIAYGTDTSERQNKVLTAAGVRLRLLSWAKLKDQSPTALANYVNAVPSLPPKEPRTRKRPDYSDPYYIEQRNLAAWRRFEEYQKESV